MEWLEIIASASIVLSMIWLASTALALYKKGNGAGLIHLYQNTAVAFYFFSFVTIILALAFYSTGNFSSSASQSPYGYLDVPHFALQASMPLAFLALALLPAFTSRNTDKIGFLVVMVPFIWQLIGALTSHLPWAMFLLGIWCLIGIFIVRGSGTWLERAFSGRYPSSEAKNQKWLNTPEADLMYVSTIGFQPFTVPQAKLLYPPSVQAVEIIAYSLWSITYFVVITFLMI